MLRFFSRGYTKKELILMREKFLDFVDSISEEDYYNLYRDLKKILSYLDEKIQSTKM